MGRKHRPTRQLSKADRLARYRGRIESAKGFRQHEQYDDLWRRLNDLYRGKQIPPGLGDDDAFVVNVAFSTINIIGPSIAINYPHSTVTPLGPEQDDQAVIAEAVINYWWRKHKVLAPFQAGVKDFLIYGFGWIKEGWKFVEEAEENLDRKTAEYESQRSQADEFAAANPELAADLPSDNDILDTLDDEGRWDWKIVEDAPFVERVSPHDVFVDPEATSMQDLRWIAQRTMKTLDELEATDGYKKSSIKNLEPDSSLPDDWFTAKNRWSKEHDHDDVGRYTCWEFYDLVTGEMCVFTDEGDKFLVEPIEMPYAFGHPFTMLRNYDVPEQFYPMGELEALEPLQNELNLTRTAMFNDRKAFRRKHLYNPQAFDRVGREALESDADNVMVPVTGNIPLGEAIIPMPGQTPNPQLYSDSQLIEGDITQVTGINEYQRGALPEIRRTATEAAIIQDVANSRAADKLARVEWAIGEISKRMLQLAQQYLHEGQAARIVGRKGKPLHFFFEPSDIQGEFDFEVQGGSTRPKNEQARRQQAMEMLSALAPFGDPQLGLVNMQEVIAHALENGFDIADPQRFLGDGTPPQGGMGAPPEEMMDEAEPPIPEDDPNKEASFLDASEAQLAGQVGLTL